MIALRPPSLALMTSRPRPSVAGHGEDTGGNGSPLSRQLRENNLAGILVFISLLFVLCQSAKIVPDIYEGWIH